MNVDHPSDSFMVLPGMKPSYTTDPQRPGEKRLAGCSWLPNRLRHLIISMLGEFVGTALFLFFAFAGTQVANTPTNGVVDDPASTATLLYISLAFGFSLLVNVWIFFRISGGLFNPAVCIQSDSNWSTNLIALQVSVALALVGAIGWLKAGLLIVSQIVGAIAAAAIVSGLLPGPLAVRTTLGSEVSVVQGLFIEALCTAELIFAIFMLAAEKHRATYLAPIGIGIALFIAELAGKAFILSQTSFVANLTSRIFHWRFVESGSVLWPRCCSCNFRQLPLDLLDWTTRRCHCCGHFLSPYQISRI